MKRDTRMKKNLADESHGMSMKRYPMNRWRYFCAILYMIIEGMSDAVPGAILPRMEIYYNINYTVVSMIWVANAVGVILVATLSQKIEQHLGARQLALGAASMTVMYTLTTPAPPFPVVVVGFFFYGVGTAMTLSYLNVVVGRFEKSSTYMGVMYGVYGVAACVGPLLATIMMDHGIRWSIIYSIMLGIGAINTVSLVLAFRGYAKDVKDWEIESNTEAEAVETTAAGTTTTASFYAALKEPITWLLALFIFFYQGAEITMSGWVVTFLEVYRHGSTRTTGYVSSGFWAGMAVGRVVLTAALNRTIGAKRGISILCACSLVCSILVWRVPNFVAEAVFVALFGIFSGPIYPMAITLALRILPSDIQIISLTMTTAVGCAGGAIFPFMVGLTSQHVGTFVVMPYTLAMFAAAFILWAFLPNPDRHNVKNYWQRIW